ncbi:hypothetical protein [Accumulibacter sp.]|uniref:hypothetical protein n=1 Tax=Accumulibacter sp. TaxID=2053492 RepID=UPI0028C3A3B8|nr:hypothetical protein [Accumulibacter sp.]
MEFAGATLGGMHAPSLLAAVIALTAVESTAGDFVVRGDVILGSRFSPYGAAFPPTIVYDPLWACLSPLSCADYEQLRRFLDRYERNYGNRFTVDPPAFQPQPPRRDVPPTPAAHIQPRYRDASQIRPEFRQAEPRLDPSSGTGK